MNKNRIILCIGAIIADIICELPHLPTSGEGLVVNDSRMSLGGCAFNNANVIRQLGCPVRLLAPLGSGMYADFIRKKLQILGLEGLEVDAQMDSGVCICLVEPDGERTMFTMPGIEREYQSDWFARLDTTDCCAALVGGYEVNGAGGEAIIAFLEANPAIQCYFAPGPTAALINREKIARINALKPIWHLNQREAQEYSHADSLMKAGRFIASESGNATVITAGNTGAWLFRPHPDCGDDTLVAAQSVTPKDTIGAGDAHLGALAAARSAGLNWKAALDLANRSAALVCQHAGPTLPDAALADICDELVKH